MKMLDIKNAEEVIRQLQTQAFLCSDDLISTNNYIIIKKTGNITTSNIMEVIDKLKKRRY